MLICAESLPIRGRRTVDVAKSGEVNHQFGIYKNTCCSSEIVLVKGALFPKCEKHKLPTTWKLVTKIEPPRPSKGKAA